MLSLFSSWRTNQLILVIDQQLPEAEDSAKEKDVDIGGDGDNKSQKLSFQFLEPAKPADDVEREENNGMISLISN